MCAPISVTTGGASGGCIGICQIVPQIIGGVAIVGVVAFSFIKGLLRRGKSFRRAVS